MKYTCTVEIDAPLEKVVSLWKDETYFKEWQDGFESIKAQSQKWMDQFKAFVENKED